MESKAARKAGAVNSTPVKSKLLQKSKLPENSNPNFKSPESKSVARINKSTVKKPKLNTNTKTNKNPITSPNKIRDRKFVVAKKNSKVKTVESVNCKCKITCNSSKCLCVAYENLRVSQDEFKKNGSEIEIEMENTMLMNKEEKLGESEIAEGSGDKIGAIVKRRRDKLMEAARQSVPETGCGRVMHLVKAFENALTLPKSETGIDNEEVEDKKIKVPKWELPGLRPKAPVTEFSSPDLFLTRESLGLESRGSTCSLDSNLSQRRNSDGGRRSRRNSFESSATSCGSRGKRRTIKGTPQKPFKLKTEQRGKSKQEEFIKKVQEMMIEQENQRIRVAQGLPWTTDEPECLMKPPVKETTRPVDLVLHSDTRAMERAEFDNQVQDKLAYIEKYKQERERQQKLEEEEELRRLRKELVPKAQPMPYFDKPFVPRRSERQPTMPKEPKFHNPQFEKMHGGQ